MEDDPEDEQQYLNTGQAKLTSYYGLTKYQLITSLRKSYAENRRLTNRLATYEPYKQRVLRSPNLTKVSKLFYKFYTRKYALKVCYIGFNYDGMSCQSLNDNTIEYYIFKAMFTMSLIPTAIPIKDYTRAGRTDKGVSAMGNVIALPLRTTIYKGTTGLSNTINYSKMLNAILPYDIRILACEPVCEYFNARYWCNRRSYKYFFARGNLNIEVMENAIQQFIGTHNFINYCKMNVTNTVNFIRTIIEARIFRLNLAYRIEKDDPRNDIFYFHFIGNSFLWHQIRFMVSILFMIGQGKYEPIIINNLFDIYKYPRKPNYVMAPYYPLILENCEYNNLLFHPNVYITCDFYNTLNYMVMRKSVEKVLFINCMFMAKDAFILSSGLARYVLAQKILERDKVYSQTYKMLSMHKASSRGLYEAISSLKGKKLELYKKKAEKQALYELRKGKEQQEPLEEDVDE